jgi:DEAD/DEAH box helicase
MWRNDRSKKLVRLWINAETRAHHSRVSNSHCSLSLLAAWRASKQISVIGHDVPKPVYTFEEASMPEYILVRFAGCFRQGVGLCISRFAFLQTEVLKCGFDKPTPIQSQGWPMALKGRNMVGISATGSGKTLAFLLPAMIHINAQVSLTARCGPGSWWVQFRKRIVINPLFPRDLFIACSG